MRMSEGADSANVPTNTTSQRQSRRNNLNDARAISRANSKLPASPLTESPNRISGAHLEVQQDHGNPGPFGLEDNGQDSDSDDSNADLQGDESARLPAIPLTLRAKSTPNVLVWILLTATTVWTAFAVYYVWNAGVSSNPSPKFLWERPDYTIFTVGLLSFISTLLINKLVSETCEELKWKKCYKRKGMPFLSFLALSSATPFEGLVHLLFSPFPRVSFQRLRSIQHRIWSLQRILLYTFQVVVGIILLLNMSIDTLFVPVSSSTFSSQPMQIKGGVISLSDSKFTWFPRYPDSFLQARAIATFGVTSGHTMYPSANLLLNGIYSPPDCPTGTDSCIQLYLSQVPPFSGELPVTSFSSQDSSPWTTPYLKVLQSPIYFVVMSKIPKHYEFQRQYCRYYGDPTNVLVICAKMYENQDSTLSLVVISGVCGNIVGTPAELSCEDKTNFHTTDVFWFNVWRRKADIIYNLADRSIEVPPENLSPIYGLEFVDGEAYLNFYDRIFPAYSSIPPNSSHNIVTLQDFLFNYVLEACALSPPTKISRPYLETLMMPWLLQQLGLSAISVKDLPFDNIISASYCKQSYKISLAPSSFYIFTVLSLCTIGWCFVRLFPTMLTVTPILSGFAEIDFANNLFAINDLTKLDSKATTTTVEKRLGDSNIRVIWRRMDVWNEQNIEMVNP